MKNVACEVICKVIIEETDKCSSCLSANHARKTVNMSLSHLGTFHLVPEVLADHSLSGPR